MATEKKTDSLNICKRLMLICGIFLILLLVLEICAGAFIWKRTIPDSAWSISLNGKPLPKVPGESLSHGMNRGDTLVCTATFPDCNFAYPALVFESIRGTFTVTNGEKTLFTSESEAAGYSQSIINQVSLRNADFSKPVTITVIAKETNSIFSVPTFELTEHREGFPSFIKERGFTLVIALFLFFVGAIGTVICSTSRFLSKKLLPLITISLFAFWASLCTFCHLGFIKVFIHNDKVNEILELASFYFAIIAIGMIIYPKLLVSKKHKRLFKGIIIAITAFSLISLILPVATPISIMDTFSITIIPYVAAVLFSFCLCIRQWIKKAGNITFTIAGFILLFIYTTAEVLRIGLHSAGINALGSPEMAILSSGLLIFTACSLLDYFVWFKESTIQETVEESWKRFSEPNSEPGISGFQKTLALLSELQESKSEYIIITISIDNIEELKLSETPFPVLEDNFARLFYLVFSSYGITGNLGKGRFMAALPDIPEGKVKQLILAFKELVRRDNQNHPDAPIIFSSGYALSTDSEDEEIVKICQLANNSRMVQEQQLLK